MSEPNFVKTIKVRGADAQQVKGRIGQYLEQYHEHDVGHDHEHDRGHASAGRGDPELDQRIMFNEIISELLKFTGKETLVYPGAGKDVEVTLGLKVGKKIFFDTDRAALAAAKRKDPQIDTREEMLIQDGLLIITQ